MNGYGSKGKDTIAKPERSADVRLEALSLARASCSAFHLSKYVRMRCASSSSPPLGITMAVKSVSRRGIAEGSILPPLGVGVCAAWNC